jgi:hypothetical protein
VLAVAAAAPARIAASAAVLTTLTAAAIGVFAWIQFDPPWPVALTLAGAVPAALSWSTWRRGRHPVAAAAPIVATLAIALFVVTSGVRYYDDRYGPTHPASAAERLEADRVEWVWSGALQPESITIVVRTAPGHSAVRVETTGAGGEVRRSAEVGVDPHRIARLAIDGLRPDTEHTYAVFVDGIADSSRGQGTFRTPAIGPMSFRVAAAACARTGSNAAVFDRIAADRPLLYLQLGDLHYENLTSRSPDAFLDAYDVVLTRAGQAALYRSVPVAYMWDDHDYGPSNSDASAPGRSAAREAYRRAVPHYPVAAGDASIEQAFTIGRVRFIVTDMRSERAGDSMLGEAQLEWLLDELVRSSRTHAAIVWASTVPWVGAPGEDDDGWAAFAGERRRIADVIAEERITNLVMVAGDAHMVALDDGTNTDYSDLGDAGFPLLHAAPLDRTTEVKGGPYSAGPFLEPGQYGLIDVEDPGGDTITVTLTGRNWRGETLATVRHVIEL